MIMVVEEVRSRMPSSIRKWLAIFGSAYSGWAAVLGTILGTVALSNLTFRFLDISVFEALASILAAYQKTFHPPIDYLLSLISLRIPNILKDGLVFYIAMAGVLYRMLAHEEPSPLKAKVRAQFPNSWRMVLRLRVRNVRAAIFWPYYLRGFIRHPSFLIRGTSAYGRIPPPRVDRSPTEQEETRKTMLSYLGDDAVVICNERQLLAVYTFALIAAVLGLVILNAAIDRLSDGY
ncbi:MAG TPA: hypothetical protein VFC54_11305 [Pseudolabrys sp.]|nr:hypothetical protein [Pseudolabrys sp.]